MIATAPTTTKWVATGQLFIDSFDTTGGSGLFRAHDTIYGDPVSGAFRGCAVVQAAAATERGPPGAPRAQRSKLAAQTFGDGYVAFCVSGRLKVSVPAPSAKRPVVRSL